MENNQKLNTVVDGEIQRIQKERQENRLLLAQSKIEQQTFEQRDATLLRELEVSFIERNLAKILF